MSDLPLEIEYKFLIDMPDIATLMAQPDYKMYELTQMYLKLPSGLSPYGNRCRIRKSESIDGTVFYKTFKSDITHLKRVEIEEEISEKEYTELSSYLLKGTAQVCKVRHTFSFQSYICEVDVFPFLKDKAFLEIEVSSDSDIPPIPEFIHVIKDVTADKAYRNSSIARMLFDLETI